MRLLNARTIKLESFNDDRQVPPYAVLSHTWGSDEVTLQDMQPGEPETKRKDGYRKIEGCCRLAVQDGLDYVWIDTCCIDKTSSAELSEAINSMFRWYLNAQVCYAYLSDVPPANERRRSQDCSSYSSPDEASSADPFSIYRSCRWFTRGWTLQELIAPKDVQFYDRGWSLVGSKTSNLGAIEKVSRIDRRFLRDVRELNRASVAQRMSWAAGRQTTRTEDRAYCLLGIFGINMPLLYGEGDRAFVRLQEEIMRDSDDQSLFAWGLGLPLDDGRDDGGLFARSPDAFAHGGSIQFWGQLSADRPTHHFMTNKGLRIELPLMLERDDDETAYAVLDCISNNKFVAIPISRAYHEDVFQRTRGCAPRTISRRLRKTAVRHLIYLQKLLPESSLTMYFSTVTVQTGSLHAGGYQLVDAYPPHAVLDVKRDAMTCGDAHRVILIFQHKLHLQKRIALLLTATYTHEEHHLSRPKLATVESAVAAGPRLNRLVEMVVRHGIWRIERGVPGLERTTAVGGDEVTTTPRRTDNSASWTVEVEVVVASADDDPRQTGSSASASPFPSTLSRVARPSPMILPPDQDSDSDGYEHITMAAIAAMFNNTNRDFRQREAWVRRREERRGGFAHRHVAWRRPRPGAARLFAFLGVGVVSALVLPVVVSWLISYWLRWREQGNPAGVVL